ncbi:unnamed protein product, partial [Didymodactylos carnosus]
GNNMQDSEFVVYDNGVNPKHIKNNQEQLRRRRRQMAATIYETKLLGLKGSRKMTVLIPNMTENDQRIEVQPQNEKEGLIERWKHSEMNNILELHSIITESNSNNLKFNDRQELKESTKNFQIVWTKDSTQGYSYLKVFKKTRDSDISTDEDEDSGD